MNPAAVRDAARAWIGTPYRHRAATLGAGCDCLGLLVGVWRMLSDVPPPTLPAYRADWRDGSHAAELLDLAEHWLRPADAGPAMGQVVQFRLGASPLPRHCGVMVSDTRFVHAQERLGVVEANMTEGWRARVAGWWEFPTNFEQQR